jgi:hypothetical protein
MSDTNTSVFRYATDVTTFHRERIKRLTDGLTAQDAAIVISYLFGQVAAQVPPEAVESMLGLSSGFALVCMNQKKEMGIPPDTFSIIITEIQDKDYTEHPDPKDYQFPDRASVDILSQPLTQTIQ